MRGALTASTAVAALVVATGAAASPGRSSLPDTRFAQLPGPPLLYDKPPKAPQLAVRAPFRAAPLLVSGTDSYRRGDYLYQDYLFDDHGADTRPGSGNQEQNPGTGDFSPAAGDVAYPRDATYKNNAADLVEFRVRPRAGALVYRLTLNTAKDRDAAIVGIGIDTDREAGEGPRQWPNGAGVSSRGLDRFVTAWGTGGEVTRLPGGDSDQLGGGAVDMNLRTNQMTIRVPRSAMDPGRRTWRYVAGVGLHDRGGGFEQVPPGDATAERPGSGGVEPAPGVFNLAFRFDEPQFSDPRQNLPTEPDDFNQVHPPYTTFPGTGNFFEDEQARLLSEGRTGGFHADVDFGALESGRNERIHPPGREQARLFSSRLRLGEGVTDGFPEFGGRLQPYLITVPRSYRDGRRAGLTFSLHSLGGTYTQYAVFSPHQLDQFGPRRDDLVVTTLGRGEDGWYMNEAEVDFFEVWRDVAHRFSLAPRRTYVSGYSMGGYGTYRLGTMYPDLFARAFTTVGPPGRGIWLPPAPPQPGGEVTNTYNLLENARWLPYMNWVAEQDQLVPYPGPTEQQNRFDRLGLRSTLETFQGDHFTLAILDEWGAAANFLGDHRAKRRPARFDYAFMPQADRPDLGLRHNHAYWISRLRARDESGNPESNPARAEIKARSRAFGQGRPNTEPVAGAGIEGRPAPSVIRGTRWTGLRRHPEHNRLVLKLNNIAHARVNGRGAKLTGRDPLRVRVHSDGDGLVRLKLPLPDDAIVRRIEGGEPAPAPEVELDRGGATFDVAEGVRRYRIFTPRR